jgi:3',5'-cyclic AMP phosphodiesterase CpdA
VIRIAHVSDLHVLSPRGVEWRRALFNKRLTGYANLLLHRARVYRREYLVTVLTAAAGWADHVVVTGDVTNLSLEAEFEEARSLLEEVARKVEVTVVPGNHDVYLPSVHAERRFAGHFGAFLRSDLPALARDLLAGPFPCVKLRGPVAIVALSSAVPRPPFVASGRVGTRQLAALAEVLAHPDVVRRAPVVLVHHPAVDRRLRLARLRDGLVDAEGLRAVLAPVARGLVLFGHLHLRGRWTLRTAAGILDVVAASGAALDHPHPAVRAGFNAYTIADDGTLAAAEAHVIGREGITLERSPLAPLPERWRVGQ